MKDKDAEVYQGIVNYFMEHGYAPSVRDVCQMAGFKSTSSGYKLLIRLAADKKIVTDGRARAIKLVGYKFVKEE